MEDPAVEEEERGEGPVLVRTGCIALDDQGGEEGPDLRGAHVLAVTLLVKEGVAFDPVDVGFFGAEGTRFAADGLAQGAEESWSALRHGDFSGKEFPGSSDAGSRSKTYHHPDVLAKGFRQRVIPSKMPTGGSYGSSAIQAEKGGHLR
jgi:hypothetical protein